MGQTLSRLLERNAERAGTRTLFSFYGGDGSLRDSYTYEKFLRRVCHVGACLRDQGLARGMVVLLAYPPGLDMAVAFYACARIGVIPAPTPPPSRASGGLSGGRLTQVALQAGARIVLTTSAIADTQQEREPNGTTPLRWIATDVMTGERDSLPETPSETLFLQYTSGSTSMPRGVVVTHANVIHNAGLCVDHDRPVGVTWLPHFHDMGLLGYYLFSLVKGGEAHCFAPLDFLRSPALWLKLISRVGGTIATAPNAAYDYCLRDDKLPDEQLAGVDLSTLRTMVNCAEPVRPGTFEGFRRRFSRYGLRDDVYCAGYGLAEHTLCVTTGGLRRTSLVQVDRDKTFVSCGAPRADVDLRIVDPNTRREVGEGEVGEIWIDSPSKAAGYWRMPEASEELFRAKIAGDASAASYLRTGDLGALDAGELLVCGRLRDMVVVNGRNVFPDDIEAALEEGFPEQLSGRVAAFGRENGDGSAEEIVVIVEAAEGVVDLNQLVRLIQDRCDVTVDIIARTSRGSIVRTSSGKVARRHCRDKWAAGAVTIHEQVQPGADASSELTDIVGRLIAQSEALGDPDITLDRLGMDSVELVNLSLALEKLLLELGIATPELMEQVADLSLLQALRASDLSRAMQLLSDGPGDTDALIGMLQMAAGAVRADEQAQMKADIELSLPGFAGAGSEVAPVSLLTGATGFLGSFLLRTLLESTADRIVVIVRGKTGAEARDRTMRALMDAGLSRGDSARAMDERVSVHCGDLSARRLGLTDDVWARLGREVGRIYHSGAEVDYVKSYAVMRPANVLGTKRILELAAKGTPKQLHYVSTTFVHGWSVEPRLLEASTGGAIDDIDFGYAQTKYVAERLVRRALESGLSGVVYRPALVTASRDGRFVERDIVTRVLGYMLRHGLQIDAPNQVSFLPVDVCTRNIVAISRQALAGPSVLHMTADGYYNMNDVCDTIAETFGYRFRKVGLERFVEHAHAHCDSEDALFPLLSFLDRNTQRILRMGAKRYDSSAYRAARHAADGCQKHPDLDATVGQIVRYLIDNDLAPAPEAQRGREGVA